MKKIIAALVAAVLCSPMSLYAAEPSHFYIGLGWGNYAFSIQNSGTTYSNSSGPALDLGYDLNNILAIQGSYVVPDTFTGTGGATENISYAASLFLRANLRFERSSIFLLAGGSYIGENNSSYKGTGPAYGIGIDFYGTKDAAITLKYVTYLDVKATNSSNKVNANGVTLGFTYYFDTPTFSDRY